MQGELVQGLRSLDDGFIPPIIDLSLLDRKIMVSNRDAIVWTRSCSTRRASSPASRPARSPRSPSASRASSTSGNVVFLIPDDGWKYLSSGVYTKPIEEIEDIDSTVWW